MSVDTQTLNEAAVSHYLKKHLDGFEGPMDVTKFQTGQSNPTFMLKTPSHNYVLRRKPPGVLFICPRSRSRISRAKGAVGNGHASLENASVV